MFYIQVCTQSELFQGEHEHIRVKDFYAQTNKKDHVAQIAAHEWKQHLLHNMETNVTGHDNSSSVVVEDERLGESDPATHYHIAKSQKFYSDIYDFADEELNDPATQV